MLLLLLLLLMVLQLLVLVMMAGRGDGRGCHRHHRVHHHACETGQRRLVLRHLYRRCRAGSASDRRAGRMLPAPTTGAAPGRGRGGSGARPRRQVVHEHRPPLEFRTSVVARVDHEERLAVARRRFRLTRQLVLDAAVDVQRYREVLEWRGSRLGQTGR